ncbi:hypothetical protein AB0O22_16895 [Streptomyces sp. NPDC091204]|uniref:hypothetical protein n=1 Tax=Streptomyces sp. NPDC091204 TaxID=3155299 RepID=UPI00341C21E9
MAKATGGMMSAEQILPEELARAAAEGVAIALGARNAPDDMEPLSIIVGGTFPGHGGHPKLFEVTLKGDANAGGFQVEAIQPHQPSQ